MHWIRRHRRGRPPHPEVLTPAEWRVLEHVQEGLTNAEISVRLGVSPNTVKTHISSILTKTGMAHRHALTDWDGRPAEASRTALGRGVALPLAGWLTRGSALTGAKVALGGLVSAVFVVSVFVAYSFFFDEAMEGESAFDGWFASPPVIGEDDGRADDAPVVASTPPAVGIAGRSHHAAILLDDGTVLVTGGFRGPALVGEAEVYDPRTGTTRPTGSLTIARQSHTATKLPDGRVIVVGGVRGGGTAGALAEIEIYDPASGTSVAGGSLRSARLAHAAVALPDGRVVVIGGIGLGDPSRDVEVIDPGGAAVDVLPVDLPGEFDMPEALLLDDGLILVVGGGAAEYRRWHARGSRGARGTAVLAGARGRAVRRQHLPCRGLLRRRRYPAPRRDLRSGNPHRPWHRPDDDRPPQPADDAALGRSRADHRWTGQRRAWLR